jgi:membrane peptidoglycan carboxypeptidase
MNTQNSDLKTEQTIDPPPSKRRGGRKGFVFFSLFSILCVGLGVSLLVREVNTSRLQATMFSRVADKFFYKLESGSSQAIRFPEHGPDDIRRGYTRIPDWTRRLDQRGFLVDQQARWSPNLMKYVDKGLFTIYQEKPRSGICILDRYDQKLLCHQFPQRAYPDVESIPPILVDMLLFIENRHLLDGDDPYQNPAIEWQRLAKAIFDATLGLIDKDRNVAGGSTLATQLEKFRHSPGGVTDNAREKLRQIISASLRTYAHGQKTLQARRRILLDYLNAIPLAAAPGFGEVLGVGDGLWAWYGMDFDKTTRLLFDARQKALPAQRVAEVGGAVKAVLSLFLAQRRPSAYLITHREELGSLSDAYCRLLAGEGLISTQVRDAAIAAPLNFQKRASLLYPIDVSHNKAAGFIRSNLMGMLAIERFYDLDRLDLEVRTGMDAALQRDITRALYRLKDPAHVSKLGLKGPYLLEKGDPSKVICSFSLYQRSPQGNVLIVQTNNFDGAFNIDEQMKLDMGSSAKLRVLIHYLDILAKLHARLQNLPKEELGRTSADPAIDPLTRWAVGYLLTARDKSMTTYLDAAMNRTYSAGVTERFFTGGGFHTFANFKKEDNARTMAVREAFRRSVNLVFIRMMREIVYYYVYQRYGATPRYLERLSETDKKRLLTLFADREGTQFIKRFYRKYNGKSPEEARDLLFMGMQPTPYRLAAVFRYLTPEAPLYDFEAFLKRVLKDSRLATEYINTLYTRYAPDNYPLQDIGYLAHAHPLEIWLVGFLQHHPQASLAEVIEKSTQERQAVYRWLFRTKSPTKQYKRIRTIIELEAFQDIHRAWQQLGYPFDYLSPSYASAIGSSGDRPAALAELIGIVLNDGLYYPRTRMQRLHFGKKTPYETLLTLKPAPGTQVIALEAAQVVKTALVDVVENGTAIRLKNAAVTRAGQTLLIGGKTGTGDHRYKTFGAGGDIISEKVLNRTAIFVFFLGDDHFGTISVYVSGPQAADYAFSSSLPVAILKTLLPDIIPRLENPQAEN